jgi:hypothetical protein
MNTHLVGEPVKVHVFVEVQARGDTDKLDTSPYSPSHLSLSKSISYLGHKPLEWCSSEVLFALCVVCWERGLPLYLYKSLRRCSSYSWCETLSYTASSWEHATACWRRGWAAPTRGWAPLVVNRPLTLASHHRLCVAGHMLDLNCFPMVFCPSWIDLMGVSLVPLRKSASESAFRWIIPCICVCDLQNNVL